MFGNLPVNEKQAFFSLLDEYFTARPNLLSGQDAEASGSAPTPAPQRSNPPPPATRKPVPSTASHGGVSIPSSLTSGKAIGNIKTSSAGAAFGSMIMGRPKDKGPMTAGEAMGGIQSAASRMNLGQQQPASHVTPAPVSSPPSLGQAEALYEYKGTEAEDLNVRAYEVVNLLEKVNEDWWKAEATDGSGRSGLVPSSYVKLL